MDDTNKLQELLRDIMTALKDLAEVDEKAKKIRQELVKDYKEVDARLNGQEPNKSKTEEL